MKKLLNKKGFTMVELIVVIAIMGIMLAIVIPILSTTDARRNEVREYARSFYSNVQELMMDEKLSGTPLPGADKTSFVLVCAQVYENKSTYNDVEIYMSYGAALSELTSATPTYLKDTDPTDAENKVNLEDSSEYKAYEEFATALRKLLLDNERSGVYFAIVDNKYRVVSTYFVEALTADEGFDDIFDDARNLQFTDECTLDKRYAGAWPDELAEKDKKLFIAPHDAN